MKFLKYFLVLLFVSGIFHHHTLESFTRSKRFFSSSYFKKPNFKNTFFRNLFTKTRQKFKQLRTRFSFRPFFTKFKTLSKKYTQKPAVKQAIQATTAGALSTITLRSFFGLFYPSEEKKIEESLSYKMAQKKTLKELENFAKKIVGFHLKFDWNQVIQTLKREQIAQKEKNLVAYHTMPAAIFLALMFYTQTYDEKNNIQHSEDFIYFRTFETIKETKNVPSFKFLDKLLIQGGVWPDEKPEIAKYMLSCSPFLFQQGAEPEESALRRSVGPSAIKKIVREISTEICKMHNIKDQKSVNNIAETIINATGQYDQMLFQVILKHDKNFSVDAIKKQAKNTYFDYLNSYISEENPSSFNFYVGYDAHHMFDNIYWSRKYGNPDNVGAVTFQRMLEGNLKLAGSDKEELQLRLMITDDLQQKGNYGVHPVFQPDSLSKEKKDITFGQIKNTLEEYKSQQPKWFGLF